MIYSNDFELFFYHVYVFGKLGLLQAYKKVTAIDVVYEFTKICVLDQNTHLKIVAETAKVLSYLYFSALLLPYKRCQVGQLSFRPWFHSKCVEFWSFKATYFIIVLGTLGCFDPEYM